MQYGTDGGNGKWKMHLDSSGDWTGARNPDRDIFLVAIGQEDARARAEALNLTAPFSLPSVKGFGRMQAGGRPMQKL